MNTKEAWPARNNGSFHFLSDMTAQEPLYEYLHARIRRVDQVMHLRPSRAVNSFSSNA